MHQIGFKLNAVVAIVIGFIGVVAILSVAASVSKAAPLPAPAASALSAGLTYQITDLGTLGGTRSEAYDINLAGTVVGWSYTITGAGHAVAWYTAIISGHAVVSSTVDLDTLGGDSSMAYGVSGNGRVAGTSATGNGVFHAFEWSVGSLNDLGALPGGPFMSSTAYDVNLAGNVLYNNDCTEKRSFTAENAEHAETDNEKLCAVL